MKKLIIASLLLLSSLTVFCQEPVMINKIYKCQMQSTATEIKEIAKEIKVLKSKGYNAIQSYRIGVKSPLFAKYPNHFIMVYAKHTGSNLTPQKF